MNDVVNAMAPVGEEFPSERRGDRVRRPVIAWFGWTVVLVLVGGAAFWAGRATFTPPATEISAGDAPTVTVSEATVGRYVPMNVVAAWDRTPFGFGSATGTLTSLAVTDGDPVDVGTTLYSVDLRPVVAARGTTPSFRDLTEGATGADVTQLQEFLRSQGYLPESVVISEKFTAATTTAVRAWQKALGVPVDGTVRASDLVFTAELPARVGVMEDTVVGTRVEAGQPLIEVLAAVPEFAYTPSDDDGDLGSNLEMTIGDTVLPIVVSDQGQDDNRNVVLYFSAPDGGPACADLCAEIPATPGGVGLQGRRVVIPEATGPSVPVAAVSTDADGSAFLTLEDGTRLPVEVLAQGDGRAVLDGVTNGTVVVLADKTS